MELEMWRLVLSGREQSAFEAMRLAVLTVSPKMDHRGTCAPPTQPLSVSQTRAAMSGQLDLVADDAAAQRARVEPDLDERGLAVGTPDL